MISRFKVGATGPPAHFWFLETCISVHLSFLTCISSIFLAERDGLVHALELETRCVEIAIFSGTTSTVSTPVIFPARRSTS